MNKRLKKKKGFNRYMVLVIIMLIIFLTIVSRLFYLQVYKHQDYVERANNRSVRFLAEKAPRGKIYDSKGNLLATNVQTYNLTFTETEDSKKDFFTTMSKVFDLLDKNSEKELDNFKLKINESGEPFFDFGAVDSETAKNLENRFKRDRGLNDSIKNSLFKNIEGDLTDEQESKINADLQKITPKETFNYLLKEYKIYEILDLSEDEKKDYKKLEPNEIANKLLKKYSYTQLRRFMLVKDALKMQSFSGFRPVNIAENIKKDMAEIFLQKLNDLSGVDISIEPMRKYPYDNLASTVLGYMSPVNPEKTEKYEAKGYDASTDEIGAAGLESSFEDILKGSKGGTTVKVNREGRKTEELYKLEPSPGQNLNLTIDKDVQYAAEQMLSHQLKYLQNNTFDVDTKNATRAAVVAINIKTGGVLAMASMPNYNPNVFTVPGALTPDVTNEYFNGNIDQKGQEYITKRALNKTLDDIFPKDKNGNRQDKYDVLPKPMYNYATMGLTPPGSTFKPLTAVAALNQGVVTPDEGIPEKMEFDEHPDVFGKAFKPQDNAFHTTAGGSSNIDIRTAIAVSCNHYFYESAYRMYMKNGAGTEALDTIAHYAWKAGLGIDPNGKQKSSTGIEIAENFGQTYNFESFKKQTIYYVKYELVGALESGNIGSSYFAPLDIAFNEDDSDELKKAKDDLKKVVTSRLEQIGTDKFKDGGSEFSKNASEAVKNLEKESQKYRDNIKSYEEKGKKNSINAVVAGLEQLIGNKKTELTTPAQLVYSSIGQGINLYTPLQIANYIATIANGGTRYKVHLVDKILDQSGKPVKEFKPEVLDTLDVPKETIDVIKQGMAMTNEEGTASGTFRNFPITTAGKTGTATFQANQADFGRAAFGVYVSFAPVEDPQVAVCTVIYDGGHGNFGAPVARAIYETYFRDELKQKYPNYKPSYVDGGTYDFTLNPSLNNYKDNGVFAPDGTQISTLNK